jgi:hypothetical protein
MDKLDNQATRISRSFRELSDEAASSAEQVSLLAQMGWSPGFGWEALVKSQRVLIVSEAGAGKTYECRAQQAALWQTGEPAFYFDLAQLSTNDLRDLMLSEEEERFDAWLASQSDVATFFLDSIDELKLTLGSFEVALKRLRKAISGQLGRARIVITTRPIPVDYRLIQQILPIPERNEPALSVDGGAFADIVMSNGQGDAKKTSSDANAVPAWRNVALMPLSNDQIREIAVLQGVHDVDAMLDDIHKRNAEEFSRRPQDLIELCADWRDHRRIRTHREQVAHNITVKLKARTDRRERAPLAEEKALEGASRLALAALLTRKLTIRHSSEADSGGEPETALDPATILPDWSADERATLLERPLFGFASYGRVRFHHRSVIEYLAAQWLERLANRGMPMKAVKRLLFTTTAQGINVVKPSIRPVAAWLASSMPNIFSEVRDREPWVLLNLADPESLTAQQRTEALRAYVERYGKGSWRGMHVPHVQVHRFASSDLGPEIQRLWQTGIENPEVRELLLELVAAVPMPEGADIAYSVVMAGTAEDRERIDALDALIHLNDPRIDAVSMSMETEPDKWPAEVLKHAVLKLFPAHIEVARLCRILSRIPESTHSVGGIDWLWVRSITGSDTTPHYLDAFREGLTALVTEDVQWREMWPHIVSPREHLIGPLAAVCLRQFKEGNTSSPVLESSVIALRFRPDERVRDDAVTDLRKALAQLPTSAKETAFWLCDAFNQRLHLQENPWSRLFEVIYQGPIGLNGEQDTPWILANLSDPERLPAERSMMFEAALRLWDGQGEWRDYLMALKDRVADCPSLAASIDDQLKVPVVSPELARMEAEHQAHMEKLKRQREADHASWAAFWEEVAHRPQTAFGPDRVSDTTWNLWAAMRNAGEQSRSSGWSRRFIEQHFSKEVADQLRLAMKDVWRNDRPTLRTERTNEEKDVSLVRWQLGLAAIAAEAEDTSWAKALSVEQAALAARYAPLELNGFPSWLDSLTAAHPVAVEAVLGPELSSELDDMAVGHTFFVFLQNLNHAAPSLAALFLPRLRIWLDENHGRIREGEDEAKVVERLRQVINVLLACGDVETRDHLRAVAAAQLAAGFHSPFVSVWLPVLMRLDPAAGTAQLEQSLEGVEPAAQGPGVNWIGLLFGNRHTASIDLRKSEFTPALLLRLIRVAYRHVRRGEDISREGAYSPASRDNAQDGRNTLLNALLEAKGADAWKAKLDMADDPLFAHFRDRVLLVAREKAAEESDAATMSEPEVMAFNRYGEASPSSRDEMFALLVDRLDDLDDLLLRDDSPRAAWAAITDEKVIRREISRELRYAANHTYKVDQESVTADEKETDIRLHAARSDQQAVIELKIGDNRSGRDLRDTIKDQLVKKYMAPEVCRSGCLLVTVSVDRSWDHPDDGRSLDIAGLEAMLQAEAEKVVAEMGASLRLTAKVLDLRSRLSTENDAAKSRKNR